MNAARLLNKPSRDGLLHILDALRFSLQGLSVAWRDETAFRLQCAALVPMVPLAFWIARSTLELVLLLAVCMLVLLAEMFNSAIERVVDRFGAEHHPLAGEAKDLGSAGVFFSLMLVLLVWLPLAWNRFAP